MMTLGCRGEDDTKIGSQFFCSKSLDHFVVSTGVKEAGLVGESYELSKSDDRGFFGEVVFSKDNQRHTFLDLGKGLQHCRGDTGEALVRIAEDEIGDVHLVEFGGVVRAMGNAETDGSDQKQVASEKFEVGFDGIGNIRVIVVTQGGFPKEGCAKKTS